VQRRRAELGAHDARPDADAHRFSRRAVPARPGQARQEGRRRRRVQQLRRMGVRLAGMVIRVPDPIGTRMIFYLWVTSVPDSNRDGYFFSPASNSTGTRYFTTAIISDCEQVKMCLFCYINYDLF
jgi:hypothetical protein